IGDKHTVNLMLNSLKYLRAESFVSEDIKKDAQKFGLDKPSVRVKAVLKDKKTGKPVTYELVLKINKSAQPTKVKAKAYVGTPVGGPIAEISASAVQDLQKDVSYFRQKKVFHVPHDKVMQIHVQRGDKQFRLLKIKDKMESWRLMNPAPQKTDKPKVNTFQNNLMDLRIQKFVAEKITAQAKKQYGLEKPERSFALFGKSSKVELGHLSIGTLQGDMYPAILEGRNKIFLLKKSDVEALITEDWKLIKGGKPPKMFSTSKPAARSTQSPKTSVTPRPAPTSQTAPKTPARPRSVPTSQKQPMPVSKRAEPKRAAPPAIRINAPRLPTPVPNIPTPVPQPSSQPTQR
ncbi:MAG: DUF4340 domain-containing protein, partial [Myxococcota bacterium]